MKYLLGLFLIVTFLPAVSLGQVRPETLRAERDKLIQRGMWRDAVTFYQEKLMPLDSGETGDDLEKTVNALGQLRVAKEFDGIVEAAVTAHPADWRLLNSAAYLYLSASHNGRILAGDFERQERYYRYSGGDEDGAAPATGQEVNTAFRDQVRALQLILRATEVAKDDGDKMIAWKTMANVLSRQASWKLQTLTPLDKLPEWGESGPDGATEGAPWKGDAPVLYQPSVSWRAAVNDGERWRFALAEQVRLAKAIQDSKAEALTILERAVFSQTQFGTETLASYGGWGGQEPDETKGILAVDTLADDECLAKTSDGVWRFKLPADQHFIALLRSIMEDAGCGEVAGDRLVEQFFNRRQFDKARQVLEQTIAKFGPGPENSRGNLLQQIIGNWGRFEQAVTVPAGIKPQLPLIFRNAKNVKLTAAPVDMAAVIFDTQAYLKSNPKSFDYDRANPSNIASKLISSSGGKYIGKSAANWAMDLTPREKHRDARIDIEVPLTKAGAWWVTAEITDGNIIHALVWIVDSVIVQSDVGGNKQWWVADAASGAPVAGAELEFFGYRCVDLGERKNGARQTETRIKSLTAKTDKEGASMMKPGALDDEYRWLVTSRKTGRALAFQGFQPFVMETPQPENEDRDITYGISDRPLYKPGDTVHLKYYFRNVGYFKPEEGYWANQSGELLVTNGRGEEAIRVSDLKTDALGAVECEVVIPKDAVLGQWNATFSISENTSATVNLRVEEYRKPEYEVVVDAPAEPVKLGEKFTVTVKANYFHGAPVRNANVEIIVKRSSMSERWFPQGRWDWLYGAGTWWNCEPATWHPMWKRWGCMPPNPPWWQGNRSTPDEVVLKKNLAIGADGTAKVEIDTAAAKAIHGDMDAKYTIEARVVDASRREERGTGTVIATRKPFEIVVWTDRGHSRAGEPVEASISAATLAGKPVVAAQGTLKIYQLTRSAEGRIEEKEVQSFPVVTDAEGKFQQKFPAPATGQYRLVASLSFGKSEAVEGATILNVQGPGRAEPDAWNFGPLELVADKATYAPGETLKLRVNSDKQDAHVWLFLHIMGSAGRESRHIQLDGKSREIEVPLDLRDMPNMYIEGVTVHGAKIHTAVRQILLPPVSKLIEVVLEPAKARVKPRETSALRVTLRDAKGKPVQGSAVVAIYDKALEAISGGSNVGLIHENFWTWKNNYIPNGHRDSIPSGRGNISKPGVMGMRSLGYFSDDFEGGSMDAFAASAPSGRLSNRARAQPMSLMASAPAQDRGKKEASETSAPVAATPILVRKDFADLLKWSGEIKTDAEGHAEIPLTFPDNLTTWKARVWVLTKGTHVGEGSAEIITSKELLIRLQAPRFLVERDEATFSAVVQNDHDSAKVVKVSLELEGSSLATLDGAAKTVEIAAKSEARVDWRVKALKEGEAKIRMRADAGDDGDAVERTMPVRVHGMLRQDAWSRTVEPEADSAKIPLEVPAERRPDQSTLTVRFSPTIAGAVVDAIPYLASYPYGCTEQTLNRFVPAVIGQKMLRDLKINLAEVKAKRTNLNPQELGNSADRAAQWKQWQTNPVFDEVEVEKMVAAGVERLLAMQISDGGWGWFSGYREISYPHTTAVVVHGLIVAKASGARVPPALLEAGINWLAGYERKQVAGMQLYAARKALRLAGKKVKEDKRYEKESCDAIDAFVRLVLGENKRDSEAMLTFLYRDRVDLTIYAKCLLGLEAHRKGDLEKRDEVMKMISQFLKRDPENQTTYLDLQNQGYWWNWYGSEIEAHAWYLKLLTAAKPNDADTRGLVKYLVNNRKHASYWESTRDTAFAIEAIAGYFKASGESAPEMEIDISLDGKSLRKVTINRENLFTFDGTIALTGDEVTTGKHEIELKKSGKGTLYANAYLEVFTLEDKLRAAGLEVKVTRHISKLIALEKENEVPDATGQIVKQQVERFRREPLADGAKLSSGDRIEVELVLESKNDYEYLLFSDAKAAGFEALDALSGYIDGTAGFNAYMEPRDQTVDFFIRSLPRGTQTVRYQLRAEAPGIYKALPTTAAAMYAPELRANSEDQKLEIVE